MQLAKELGAAGVEIISTGGTLRLLAAAELAVSPMEEDTGFPEILDGKWGTRCMASTLHAQVVSREQRLHEREELRAAGFRKIDLVVRALPPQASRFPARRLRRC